MSADKPQGAQVPIDPHLKAALTHAPDANQSAPAALSQAILQAARQSVQPRAAPSPSKVTAQSTNPLLRWWQNLGRSNSPWAFGGAAAAALATVVLWVGKDELPQTQPPAEADAARVAVQTQSSTAAGPVPLATPIATAATAGPKPQRDLASNQTGAGAEGTPAARVADAAEASATPQNSGQRPQRQAARQPKIQVNETARAPSVRVAEASDAALAAAPPPAPAIAAPAQAPVQSAAPALAAPPPAAITAAAAATPRAAPQAAPTMAAAPQAAPAMAAAPLPPPASPAPMAAAAPTVAQAATGAAASPQAQETAGLTSPPAAARAPAAALARRSPNQTNLAQRWAAQFEQDSAKPQAPSWQWKAAGSTSSPSPLPRDWLALLAQLSLQADTGGGQPRAETTVADSSGERGRVESPGATVRAAEPRSFASETAVDVLRAGVLVGRVFLRDDRWLQVCTPSGACQESQMTFQAATQVKRALGAQR